MKKGSTLFLQVVIVLIGLAVLVFMLWEPHLEGRNVNATWFEIYFKDAFLAYVYAASIAFFTALYQGIKLLGYIGKDAVFSLSSVKTLRIIKYCALCLVAFILGAEGYLVLVQRQREDDITGGVMLGLLMMFASITVASVAATFERVLQTAVDLKSENDLTV